jgi:D-alanyl-D-alanine carboxypeptidase (penicillin-binding protein 5/6)
MKKQTLMILLVLLGVVCLLGTVAIMDNPAPLPPETTPVTTTVQTAPQPSETTPVTTPSSTVTEPEETEPEETQPVMATIPADRVLTAQNAFVYDCNSREFAYILGDPEDTIYPASITKLVTAFTVLQYLNPEETVLLGSEQDLVPWDSSVAGLQKEDRLTVEQLIEGMLLPSGNDAATALAVAAGRVIAEDYAMAPKTAIKVFMKEMNRTAKSYGMGDSHFVTPDGYHDPDHYTTMEDLAVLGRLVLSTPAILKYTALPSDQIVLSEDRVLEWKNTNALINPESEFYCSAAVGLKTGQHSAAGRCLLSAFQIGDRTLIIGVFGCTEDPARFEDTLQLLQQTIG